MQNEKLLFSNSHPSACCVFQVHFISRFIPQVQSTAHRTRLSAGMSTPRFAEGETEAGQEQRDLPSALVLKT